MSRTLGRCRICRSVLPGCLALFMLLRPSSTFWLSSPALSLSSSNAMRPPRQQSSCLQRKPPHKPYSRVQRLPPLALDRRAFPKSLGSTFSDPEPITRNRIVPIAIGTVLVGFFFQAVLALSESVSRGTLLACGAALAGNVGKVCQKRGTESLPLLEFKLNVLKAYVSNLWWIIGLLLDVSGALITLAALSMAPVSVVQPILGSGPGIVAVASSFLTADRLARKDWAAALLCVLGTVGLGLSAVENTAAVAVNAAMAGTLCLLFATGAAGSELLRRRRALSSEISASVSAGVCFGLSACSVRTGMLLAADWGAVLGLAGVATSVLLTTSGFIAQTRGLKGGRALSVVVYSNLVAVSVAVIFGLGALAEPLPGSSAGLALWAVSLSLLVAGSLLLSAQNSTPARGLEGEGRVAA